MTLATSYNNAALDESDKAVLAAYATQINSLERTEGATPDYDAGLEREFNAIKAQLIGNHAADASPPTTGGPLPGKTGAPPTGPTDPGPPPPERASIGQIESTAGPGAAASVQQIADNVATNIGGSAGTTVADGVAQAGAQAAQHVINTGGSSAEAGAAATTAAGVAAAAGEAGGAPAAANVAHLAAVLDPATVQNVANTANQAATVIGGGAGTAIANMVTSAASKAATIAAASGLDAAQAAETAAQAVSNAATAVGPEDALLAATYVADAIAVGGAEAGSSVAAAAAAAGIDAAQVVASGAEDAFEFAGGTAAIEAGAGTAGLIATTIGQATSLGKMSAIDATSAGKLVADAAAQGGNALASAVSSAVNFVSVGHSADDIGRDLLADMTKLAGDVTAAFTAHGVDAAQAVTDITSQAFESMVSAPHNGVDLTALTNFNHRVSAAAVSGGTGLTGDLSTIAKTVNNAGGNVKDMQQSVDAVTSTFNNSGQEAADAATAAIVDASANGVSFRNAVSAVLNDIAASGTGSHMLTQIYQNMTRALSNHGQDAVDTIQELVKAASDANVPHLGDVADVISSGGEGGKDLAINVSTVATAIATHGGTAENIDLASLSVQNSLLSGGPAAAQANVSAGELAIRLGATSDQTTLIVTMFAQNVRLEQITNGAQAAGSLAGELLDALKNAADQPGAGVRDLTDILSTYDELLDSD